MKKILFIISFIAFSIASIHAQNDKVPLVKSAFRVKMDNIEILFQEVSGLSSEKQTFNPKGGNGPALATVKMPGITKIGEVTMKKGTATTSKKLTELLSKSNKSGIKKSDITIEMMDENSVVTMSWVLKNAYFSKVTGVSSSSSSTSIATLSFAHEGITAQ